MIKAVFFDLGNVCFWIDLDGVARYIAKHYNRSYELISQSIELDDVFLEYEKGNIDDQEICNHLSNQLGFDLSLEQFHKAWNNIYVDQLPNVLEVVKQLRKQNISIFALSNTNASHEQVWSVKYQELLSQFDYLFCSHHLHTAKPELAIYNKALQAVQLDANECIFLDDKLENVEAAVSLGIHAYQIKEPIDINNALSNHVLL